MNYHSVNGEVALIADEQRARKSKYAKRQKRKRMLIAFIIVVLVITVFLSVMLNVASTGTGLGNLDGAYGTVLADIEGITEANPRVIDIAMLGSHDAVTDKLTRQSPIDKYDQNTILGKIDPITGGFQLRFGITQKVDVGQQLLQGSRWFHIKYTNYDGVWYGTHAHLSDTIENYVLQLLEFLASHKGEIVLVEFQPMYLGDQTYQSFHDWLATVKLDEKNIYDYVHYSGADVFANSEGVRIGDLRYNDVTLSGTSAGLVLLDRRESERYVADQEGTGLYADRYFDMDSHAIHTWHSRIGSKVLIEKINEQAALIESSDEYDDKLRVNQTQASFSGATFGDVMRDIGCWSLTKFAEKHNVRLIENENFGRWLKAMPVFQVDFVNSSAGDFNRRVNALIRARNEELCAQAAG